MKRKWLWLASFFLIVCANTCGFAQKSEGAKPNWPRYFAPDNENAGLDDAEPPSDQVLDALLATDEVHESAEEI